MPLIDYQLIEILPDCEKIVSSNPNQGDMLVELAEELGLSGVVIAQFDDLQFELLQGSANVLARHARDGLVGIYQDNSLGVREAWARRGLGVALVLYAYDHDKTPSPQKQFTKAGAATIKRAMRVAQGLEDNPFW